MSEIPKLTMAELLRATEVDHIAPPHKPAGITEDEYLGETYKQILMSVAGLDEPLQQKLSWMTPPMVAAEALSAMANPLSGPSALERNLDRMAERVRDEAIAEFMATPEAKAAQAELLSEAKARVASALERIELGRPDFTSEMNAPAVVTPPFVRFAPSIVVMVDTGGPTAEDELDPDVELAARRKRADQQRPIDPSINHQDWGWCIRCRLDRYKEGRDRLCAWCWERSHKPSPAAQSPAMVAVDMAEAEAYGATVPDDGCWRPEQVNPRGRWRMKKRALRLLAEDLGYPECMEVAHPEQIDGTVMQAGVRLRDFYKLHRVRTTPAQAKAERAQRRADKREMAACLRRGELPF